MDTEIIPMQKVISAPSSILLTDKDFVHFYTCVKMILDNAWFVMLNRLHKFNSLSILSSAY